MTNSKRDDVDEAYDQAVNIQTSIDEVFGIDIAAYQTSELETLSILLKKFLATGVETEDLRPADEYSEEFDIDYADNEEEV